MKCLVLSLRGVSHSARAQTQLLMQRELFPSPLTSNLSQENQEQPQANSHLPTHLWVGFSITCDISFPHVSGGKLHVCVESKQPIIHILLLVPLDKFSLLEEAFGSDKQRKWKSPAWPLSEICLSLSVVGLKLVSFLDSTVVGSAAMAGLGSA